MTSDNDKKTENAKGEGEEELEIKKETVDSLDDEQLEGVTGGRFAKPKMQRITNECETDTCCRCDGKITET